MPKIKECPHCNAVLVCQACGQRVTPNLVRKGRKKKMTFGVAPDVEAALRKIAEDSGISLNDVVEAAVKKAAEEA